MPCVMEVKIAWEANTTSLEQYDEMELELLVLGFGRTAGVPGRVS